MPQFQWSNNERNTHAAQANKRESDKRLASKGSTERDKEHEADRRKAALIANAEQTPTTDIDKAERALCHILVKEKRKAVPIRLAPTDEEIQAIQPELTKETTQAAIVTADNLDVYEKAKE